jgi:asparagine synthetase B (glutamine-hydrolysing)
MITLVLLSGGLDSAVLAAHEAQTARVLPVYVSVGLAWEEAEVVMVERTARLAGLRRASRAAVARVVHDA